MRRLVDCWGYAAHIKSMGEEGRAWKRIPGYRAGRRLVERTHLWLNRLRRLLIRWETKADNYAGMLYPACARMTFRAAAVLG